MADSRGEDRGDALRRRGVTQRHGRLGELGGNVLEAVVVDRGQDRPGEALVAGHGGGEPLPTEDHRMPGPDALEEAERFCLLRQAALLETKRSPSTSTDMAGDRTRGGSF
ncbi:MAG TPA: hypothetical protein VGL49_06210 [Acidimicrobiales bacterium]